MNSVGKDTSEATLVEKLQQLCLGPKEPEREFIIGGATYAAVYDRARALKTALAGVQSPVCLCAEDKVTIAAALLASLAGSPEFILPYAFSRQGLQEVRDACGATCAVSDTPRELPAGMTAIVCAELPAGEGVLAPVRGLDESCIKLYTGGTTGNPKIWSKTPRNIFAESFHHVRKYGLTKKDRFLATVPPYHIYGLLFSVTIPFVAGARVLQEICTFPQEIISGISSCGATVLVSVPMHYRVLRKIVLPDNPLRYAFSSAGALDPEDGRAFHEQTGTGVIEVYGSTETGGIATRSRSHGERSLTPIDSVSWKILHERLCVRSEFISPELPRDGEGFYMTGDRAQQEAKGTFSLLGRADGVIKVAGRRVDLADVQSKIRLFRDVRDALVIALPAQGGRENEIVAIIEAEITEATIRQLMSKVLEPYAIPRRMMIVSQMPLLSTGKVDRKAIEELFGVGKKG